MFMLAPPSVRVNRARGSPAILSPSRPTPPRPARPLARRGLLALLGTGTGLALAGCASSAADDAARPRTGEIVVWLRDQNADARRVFAERIVPAIHELVPGLILTILWKRWNLALPGAAGQTDAMPDIFQFGHTDAVSLLPGGLATDLTSHWAVWGAGADFFPASRAAAWWQGASAGIPTSSAPTTVFWRRDLLEQIGLDTVPTTFEETVEVARRAKSIDNGILRREGLNPPTVPEVLALFMSVSGRPVVTAGRSGLNSAAGRLVLRYVIDRWQASQDDTLRLSLPDTALPPLLLGTRLGQYGNAVSTLRHFVTDAPELLPHLEVGRPLVPGGFDYKPATPGVTAPLVQTYTDSIALAAGTRAPDLAWETIRQLTSPATLAAYNEALFLTPPRRSATGRGFTLQPGQAELVRQLETWGAAAPRFPALPAFSAAIESRLAPLLVGFLDIDEALTAIEAEQNAALAAAGFEGDIVPTAGIRG